MANKELFDKINKAVFETSSQSCEIWNQIKDLDKQVNPCDKCPNNKANNPNASGICNCAAPYFDNPIIIWRRKNR